MWNEGPFPQLPGPRLAWGAGGAGRGRAVLPGCGSLSAGEAHMLGEDPQILPASVSTDPCITHVWSKAKQPCRGQRSSTELRSAGQERVSCSWSPTKIRVLFKREKEERKEKNFLKIKTHQDKIT